MPPALLYTLGVVVFALGLLLSIALHEIGHMVPAKKFGVKVTQYMVGFGPTLWSRKRGDTEYGFKAIPLGGYIRMIGMVPPAAVGKRSRWPRRLATAVEDFRSVSRSEVDPQDAHREFYRLTPGKKMIVMLGGPVMNLFIFLILTVVLLTTIGVQNAHTTTTVGSVEKCVVAANSKAAGLGTCPATAKTTPAFGVLEQHDHFVSINGVKVTSWNQLTSLIQPAAGKRLTIVVRRDGKLVTLHATPVRNRNYIDDSDTKTAIVGFLGFAPHVHYFLQTVSITGVPGQIGSQLHVAVDALGNTTRPRSTISGTPCSRAPSVTRTAPSAWSGSAGCRVTSPAARNTRPKRRCSRCWACWPASTCCCSSSTCCRCCRWTAATSQARWWRRVSVGERGSGRAASPSSSAPTASRCPGTRSSSTPRRCCPSCTRWRPCSWC